MKTDVSGGASAYDKLEERLAGRFATELDRAERDYPAFRLRFRRAAEDGRTRRAWPRLLAVPVGIAALLLVVIVGSPLLLPRTVAPVVPAPGSAGVTLGADGIPNQIDGQRVYRVTEQQEWQDLSGSFLLGAYPVSYAISCPSVETQPSAEADLRGQCGGMELAPFANENPSAGLLMAAPRGLAALYGMVGGPAVVMRVHTHDPEAAQCSADRRPDCDAAVVVEAVVWPTVPTEIAGERVHRAADQASFPRSGSFLLGGLVTMPDVIPPCPAPIDKSDAEQQLVPYCSWVAIDGLHLAPKGDLNAAKSEIVVARVHVHDPLAAQCPADVRADCEAAIVVEAVVWRNAAVQASPTPPVAPSSAESSASENPVSQESAGPSASAGDTGPVQLGPDGVPTAIGAEKVYRASNLPTSLTFLLGGKLTLDVSPCPSASSVANPPACGYWMLDGVKVATLTDLSDSLRDQVVVARVDQSRVLAVCPAAPCDLVDKIVIAQIVWQTLTPPPPPGASAS